jgi:hypothetical protein
MVKPLAIHQRTDGSASFASPPILIALAKQGSYVIVNFVSPTNLWSGRSGWNGRRPLDDDLLPLHFRGTSYALQSQCLLSISCQPHRKLRLTQPAHATPARWNSHALAR